MSALLAAGLVMRVLTMIAYRPALLYIDSLKYLFNAWPGTDPVGYKIPLWLILRAGNLQSVAAVQHLAGLAMAVTIYVVLVRRGAPRWLAACATAPMLLDAYQLQAEQMIMPDVWFEALIVAGLAVLLWRPGLTPWSAVAAGLLLGATTTAREIGGILILPALSYTWITAGGWPKAIRAGAALSVAFVAPIVVYGSVSYAANGHFRLSRSAVSQAYGRAALAADCGTLRIPGYQRPLCPGVRLKALGADGLDHAATSPLTVYLPPRGMSKSAVVAGFVRAVLLQQPVNVLRGVARDAVELFALTRNTRPGDPPIARWQFQVNYPTYGQDSGYGGQPGGGARDSRPIIGIGRDGRIVVGLNDTGATSGPYIYRTLSPAMAGKAAVDRPVARFLRSYQLRGGYTPGPLYAMAALAGLAGSLSFFRRGAGRWQRDLSRACLLFFTTAAAILLASDFFEFSWRYQLPAVVCLPPAGALGIAVIGDWLGGGRAEAAPR